MYFKKWTERLPLDCRCNGTNCTNSTRVRCPKLYRCGYEYRSSRANILSLFWFQIDFTSFLHWRQICDDVRPRAVRQPYFGHFCFGKGLILSLQFVRSRNKIFLFRSDRLICLLQVEYWRGFSCDGANNNDVTLTRSFPFHNDLNMYVHCFLPKTVLRNSLLCNWLFCQISVNVCLWEPAYMSMMTVIDYSLVLCTIGTHNTKNCYCFIPCLSLCSIKLPIKFKCNSIM